MILQQNIKIKTFNTFHYLKQDNGKITLVKSVLQLEIKCYATYLFFISRKKNRKDMQSKVLLK